MFSKCKKCGFESWSIIDKRYAQLYGCWSCDKEQWEQGKLSLEEFEKREKNALNFTMEATNNMIAVKIDKKIL